MKQELLKKAFNELFQGSRLWLSIVDDVVDEDLETIDQRGFDYLYHGFDTPYVFEFTGFNF